MATETISAIPLIATSLTGAELMECVQSGNTTQVTTSLIGTINNIPNRMTAVEQGQLAGMIGYTTLALLNADLAHAVNTLAIVTNDATAANNTTYIKLGASGSGSWQAAADRITALTTRVTTLESGPFEPAIIDATTARTLSEADHGADITFTNASPVTVYVPEGLTPGFYCKPTQGGAGSVTVTSVTPVVVKSAGSLVTSNGIDSVMHLSLQDALTSRLSGDRVGNSNMTVDLFVKVGQSNRVGEGDSTLSPNAPYGIYTNGTTITTPIADPVGSANTGSMCPAFANAWFAQTGRRAVFTEAAVVGSALLAAAGTPDWSPTGTLRALAVTAANNARTKLVGSGYTVNSVRMLWAQGETDAAAINGSTVTGALYNSALQALYTYFMANVTGMTGMWISQLGGTMSATGGIAIMAASNDNWLAIRQAQADAVTAIAGNLKFSYQGAYAFGSNGYGNNALHYNQRGYNTMGACEAYQIATPVSPGAISPFLSSTNYADTVYTAASTRTDSHTTTAGTTLVVVAVLIAVGANNAQRVVTTTFGGVAMRLCADVEAFTYGNATNGRAQVHLFYMDVATYGSSLSNITANITTTLNSTANVLSHCVFNAKDVAYVDSAAGIFPSPASSTSATATIDTFTPTLVITAAASTATATTVLTCALTNSTKVMDAGATDGTANAVQVAAGYSVEAAALSNRAITATWSASCLSIAVASVAFRAKFVGE